MVRAHILVSSWNVRYLRLAFPVYSELDLRRSPSRPLKAKGPVTRPLRWSAYCDRGTCGPAGGCGAAGTGAGGVPLAGPGTAGPEAGGRPPTLSRIDRGLRSMLARIDSSRLVAKNSAARIAVARLSTLAVPRLDMKLPAPPPPMPRPPPSDFCNRTRPTMASTIMRWITMITVCINGPNQAPNGPLRPVPRPLIWEFAAVHTRSPRPFPLAIDGQEWDYL